MITCIFMFITKLFKVAKNNLNILQLMKWINKMWYIQKMDYYSATTRSELLIQSTMWTNIKKHSAKQKKPDRKTHATKSMRASLVAQMVKNLQCRRPRFDPWDGKIHWRRERLSTPVFLPGEFHGQRRLAVYSPWNCKE